MYFVTEGKTKLCSYYRVEAGREEGMLKRSKTYSRCNDRQLVHVSKTKNKRDLSILRWVYSQLKKAGPSKREALIVNSCSKYSSQKN